MKVTRLARLEVRRRRFVRMVSRNASGAANLAWGLVVIGGVVECFWVGGLKHAAGAGEWALVVAGIAFSFVAMMFACKVLEVSVAYAVFVGIGTAGVVLSEIFVFGEPFSAAKVGLIALLLAAVVALKFTSAEGGAHETAALEGVSEQLGLDEKIRAGLGLAADGSSVRGARSHLGGRGDLDGGFVGAGANSNLAGADGAKSTLNSNLNDGEIVSNSNLAGADEINSNLTDKNGADAGATNGAKNGANSATTATAATAHAAPETKGAR